MLIGQLSEDRLVPEQGSEAILQSEVREDLALESDKGYLHHTLDPLRCTF